MGKISIQLVFNNLSVKLPTFKIFHALVFKFTVPKETYMEVSLYILLKNNVMWQFVCVMYLVKNCDMFWFPFTVTTKMHVCFAFKFHSHGTRMIYVMFT
jgi:hypothetical protein